MKTQPCPACGGTSYSKVPFEGISVRFQHDRKCDACSTVYSVHPPWWARLLLVLVGVTIFYLPIHFRNELFLDGIIPGVKPSNRGGYIRLLILVAPISAGCLYCAFADLMRRSPTQKKSEKS